MSDVVHKNALILINDYVMRHKLQANYNFNMHIAKDCKTTFSCFLRIGIVITNMSYGTSKKIVKLKAAEEMLKMISSETTNPMVKLQTPIDAYALWNGIDQYVTLQNGKVVKTVLLSVEDQSY